jgi:hypothetical protein
VKVLGVLLIPVLAAIAHSFIPQKVPDSEVQAQQKETSKRFKTLIEMTDQCVKENKTLLRGLLERTEDGALEVPEHTPCLKKCTMPEYLPLEDRFRCDAILSQARKAFECKPNDMRVTHALLTTAAVLAYELEYIRRETLQWHPAIGIKLEENEEKAELPLEMYRSGEELDKMISSTAENVMGLIRDHTAPGRK